MSAESNESGYTCPFCNAIKADENSLKSHFTRTHADEMEFEGKYPDQIHDLLPEGSEHVQKVCKHCREPFTVLERYNNNREFCSNTCRMKGSSPSLQEKAEDGDWGASTAFIRRRDDETCQVCGREQRTIEGTLNVHHIVPRSKGGPDVPSNLVALCQDCHHDVHRAYSEHGSIWSALQSIMCGETDE